MNHFKQETTMNQKLKSLDIIKGISIIMIIITHNRHFIMQNMSVAWSLINYGQMGCQFFFFVSGFSLCYTWEHMDHSRCKAFRFILRRYLKLAPGFLIFMAIHLALNILLMDILHFPPGFIINRDPRALLTNALFLHGLFPAYVNNGFPGGWYLGTAFLLYVTFPLLYTIIRKLHTVHPLCMAAVPALLLLFNCALQRQIADLTGNSLPVGNNTFLYYFFTNQLPCFSLGILLFFRKETLRTPLALSAALSAAFTGICIYLYVYPPTPFLFTVLPTIAGLSAYWLAAALLLVENRRPFVSPVSRFLASCGQNSYGMYLCHSLVCWYGMKAITHLILQNGGTYNDLLLYGLVFAPSVLVVYGMGLYTQNILKRIDHRLRQT